MLGLCTIRVWHGKHAAKGARGPTCLAEATEGVPATLGSVKAAVSRPACASAIINSSGLGLSPANYVQCTPRRTSKSDVWLLRISVCCRCFVLCEGCIPAPRLTPAVHAPHGLPDRSILWSRFSIRRFTFSGMNTIVVKIVHAFYSGASPYFGPSIRVSPTPIHIRSIRARVHAPL